jgi:hypothetical protein
VDASAEAGEVQAFLERCVSASQAQVFYELLSRYVAGKPLKVPCERLAELVRPAAVEPVKQPPISAAAPMGAPTAPPPPAKAVAPAVASKPGGRSSSARSAPEKAPTLAPEKGGKKKSSTSQPRNSEASKAGTNHNRAASRSAAVRKKK